MARAVRSSTEILRQRASIRRVEAARPKRLNELLSRVIELAVHHGIRSEGVCAEQDRQPNSEDQVSVHELSSLAQPMSSLAESRPARRSVHGRVSPKSGRSDSNAINPLLPVAGPLRFSATRMINALFAATRQQRTQFIWIQITPNVPAIRASAERLVGV